MTAAAAPVVLALGSNLGDRLAHLQAGVDLLTSGPELTAAAVSPVYQTAPVGGPPQPDYLNAVLTARTQLSPAGLLALGQAAERAAHRVRRQRFGPRTLDVDVIAYGDEISAGPQLILPHPRAHERAFVLVPWLDLDPRAQLPGRGAVAGLLAALGPAAAAGLAQVPGARLRIAGMAPGPGAR